HPLERGRQRRDRVEEARAAEPRSEPGGDPRVRARPLPRAVLVVDHDDAGRQVEAHLRVEGALDLVALKRPVVGADVAVAARRGGRGGGEDSGDHGALQERSHGGIGSAGRCSTSGAAIARSNGASKEATAAPRASTTSPGWPGRGTSARTSIGPRSTRVW